MRRAIANLKYFAAKRQNCDESKLSFHKEAELLIMREIQQDVYAREISCLQGEKLLPKDSSLINLSPSLDKDGLLRIGGRLENSDLSEKDKHPYIIPGKSHIARLMVLHHHEKVRHQGNHLTEGSIRSGGLWITGVKRLINSLSRNCVGCIKL